MEEYDFKKIYRVGRLVCSRCRSAEALFVDAAMSCCADANALGQAPRNGLLRRRCVQSKGTYSTLRDESIEYETQTPLCVLDGRYVRREQSTDGRNSGSGDAEYTFLARDL